MMVCVFVCMGVLYIFCSLYYASYAFNGFDGSTHANALTQEVPTKREKKTRKSSHDSLYVAHAIDIT